MKPFHDQWVSQVKERLEAQDGYPGILKMYANKGGRFSSWHLLAFPDWDSEKELDTVVNIGCVFPKDPHYTIFLSWANESADRALADNRFNIDPEVDRPKVFVPGKGCRGWRNEGTYPGNHGKTLVNACFAHALRDNSELDEAALLTAIEEIAESSLYGGSSLWDVMSQSEYLRCVRLALVAGRVDKALLYLKNIRRKFKQTSQHHQWLQSLCNAINAAEGEAISTEAANQFQEFFDAVRDPQAKLHNNQNDGSNLFGALAPLRLELAVIKHRFILKQPLAGQWHQILGLISE